MTAAWRLFTTALAVRIAYVAAIVAVGGRDALLSNDSYGFLLNAATLAEQFGSGMPSGWTWLGPDTGVMPVFPLILAGFSAVFGASAAFAFVAAQAVADSLTCVVVAGIAQRVRTGLYWPAGLFAAFNPTMVAMSGLVLTDTLFTLFVTLALSAALRWIAAPGNLHVAVALGVWLGLALATRAVILPALFALAIYMVGVAIVRRAPLLRSAAQVGLALVIALAFLFPVVARNVAQYDSFAITSQTGAHSLLWIVPLAQEAKDGTPRAVTVARLKEAVAAHVPDGIKSNPFAQSRAMSNLAWEQLAELGVGPLVEAWLRGIAINLAAPAMTMIQPLARLPRAGFMDTPGDGFWDKTSNFLAGGNALYSWVLLIGGIGVAGFRLVQVVGLYRGAVPGSAAGNVDQLAFALLVLWGIFVLLVSGPVATPKYRLPMEPVLCVLFAFGWSALHDRFGRGRARSGFPSRAG
jgi:4-amino-4-deoxy-L-arabinose transferase-like glycosyltransferase